MRSAIAVFGGLGLVWVVGCGDDGSSADGADASTEPGTTAAGTGSVSGSSATPESSTDTPSDDSASIPTGSSSTTGSGGESSSGGPAGSAGCGMPAEDATLSWVGKTVDVGGVLREFWVWLPEPYDPDRAYPVVYQFHGCSGAKDRQNNNPPVQDQSGADAIHIRGRAVDDCWDNGGESDFLFFDAMVADVEATWCADAERRFATGYSSGAFMSHRLGCARAEMLRGIASIAGGTPGDACAGQVAALIIHDADDSVVSIDASSSARDSLLSRNNCNAAAGTTPVDPAPCEAYAECDDDYPVVWCQTAGLDHARQDDLAAPAFWAFLEGLPPVNGG